MRSARRTRGVVLGLVMVMATLAPATARAGLLNRRPYIDALSVSPSPIPAGALATISCSAHDSDGVVRRMRFTVTGGMLPAGGTQEYVTVTPAQSVTGTLVWRTPPPGSYNVSCWVQDDGGSWGWPASASSYITVNVEERHGSPPAIASLTASATEVFPGAAVDLAAVASDPDGDPITYSWSAAAGSLAPAGALARWTAPDAPGAYAIELTASDPSGLAASTRVVLQVVWAKAGAPIGAAQGGAFYPERLAVDGAGNVWITEPRRRQVLVFTKLGGLLRKIPVAGRPAGIALSAAGRLYLGDADAGAVAILDALGVPAGQLGAGDGEFELPLDLAVDDTRGRVYVADGPAAAVKVYDLAGAPLDPIELPGTYPTAVALAADGTLFVASGDGGKVLPFAPDGTAQAAVGSFGNQDGQLSRPSGALAVGTELYVVDAFQARVVVYRGGAFFANVGTFGKDPGQLRVPIDPVFDSAGRLLVTNANNARVEIFELQGSAVPVCLGDADCDGLTDTWELLHGLDPLDPFDAWQDVDGDGLVAVQEALHGTDPYLADTDGDGTFDGDELQLGLDPLDPSDLGLFADAGDDFESDPTRVYLDGSASRHGRAPPPVFEWTQVGGPPVALENLDTASPSFIARAAGRYAFGLRVGDGTGLSASSYVEVVVRDVPATADAGPDVGAQPGRPISLDGRFSGDANGDGLLFEWTQVEGPAVVLADATTARPAFTPPSVDVYVFELSVRDGPLRPPGVDRVTVVASEARDTVPTAVLPRFAAAVVGDVVALDGRGSSDAEGAPLGFHWTQLLGPPVALADPLAAASSFVPPEPGTYRFELVVDDGVHVSLPATLTVGVHSVPPPPLAAAGPDRRVLVNDDADVGCGGGDGLTCMFRQVEGVYAPLAVEERRAVFVPLQSGTYAFEVELSDEEAPWRIDRVTIVADGDLYNGVPAASGALVMPLLAGPIAVLEGRSSADPEGTRLGYTWTQVRGPRAVVFDPYTMVTQATVPLPAAYAFELRADDGQVRSPPALVEYETAEGSNAGGAP